MLKTPDDLIRFLDRWKGGRIVVAGDYMVDHYVYGNADRLSPDAPVPVLAIEREEHKPGGSANVCLDLRALNCHVACLGVVGDDATAGHLRSALRKAGCDVSGLITTKDRPTTVKQNIVGLAQHRHPQKMFRIDTEKRHPIPAAAIDRIMAAARRALKKADVLCLEDYNKGVLTPELCRRLIALARKMKVPVMVDPAAVKDYSKFAGATCLKCNRFEATLATGKVEGVHDRKTWDLVGKKLVRDLGLEAVVITLDKHGALLAQRGKPPVMVPTVARQVYDVTGAGDMVLAMLSAAAANGADWTTATHLANLAAGLEVERFGVVPIELHEILLAVLEQRRGNLGKVRTLAQLGPELHAHRKSGKKIAFTNGCFDILHAGHVTFLREARRAGDLLVVGLNSDPSIRRLKGSGRPVNHEADRIAVLSELQSVDYIVVFDEQTPAKLINAVKPDALVKGADYKKSQVVGAGFVERHGGRVVLVPLVEGRSTTQIISKISGKAR